MNRLFAMTIALLAVAVTVIGCTSHGSMYASRWETLIDGNTGMDNWTRVGDGNWRAADGSIQVDKKTPKVTSFLVSKKSYKDLVVYAEFWAADDTNSGLFIRCTDPNKISSASGYEAQIYDRSPRPEYGTGSLVNLAVVNPIHNVGGRWNTYEIYAKGSQITVKLNGVVTVSTQDSRFGSGPIALQFSDGPKGAPSGPIKWRKIAIREL